MISSGRLLAGARRGGSALSNVRWIGKEVQWGKAAGGAMGRHAGRHKKFYGGMGLVGAGLYGMGRSMVSETPRNTPIMDTVFEGILGDSQVDRQVLGTDVSLFDMWPYAGWMNAGRKFQMINPTTFSDINIREQQREFATRSASRGGRGNRYTASGDIVLGLHNGR